MSALSRRAFLRGLGASGAAALALPGCRWLRDEPSLRLTPLSQAAARAHDVCIVGSGPAGARLGLLLARAGARVLILESGLPLGFEDAAALRAVSELDLYEVGGALGYPLIASRLRALGGTSNLWTGRCSRLHPIDFEPQPAAPEGWPIAYADLAAWYPSADQALRVRGAGAEDGRAPREQAFPLEDRAARERVEAMRADLAQLDVGLSVSPTSTSEVERGPVRAPEWLRPFSAEPDAALVVDATVAALRVDAEGRVVEAEVASSAGANARIRADAFVVACGGVESARLLLLSTGSGHERGLGNAGDQVGRGFNEHPNLSFSARRATPVRFAIARSHSHYDAFKQRGLGALILVFELNGEKQQLEIGASLEMAPSAANRVTLDPSRRDRLGRPATRLQLDWSEADRRTLAAARELIRGFYAKLDVDAPSEAPLGWSHHHIGGCRMSHDAARGVVDPELRVHGTRNLYVLGSAVFPTGGAAHPTLGIVALAQRLAAHLGAEAETP